MDGNGLFVCPAPSRHHIVHSVGSLGAKPHSKVVGAQLERPGLRLQVLVPPGGNQAGPITVRSEVISMASSGCTQRELGGGGQKETVAWDSEQGKV